MKKILFFLLVLVSSYASAQVVGIYTPNVVAQYGSKNNRLEVDSAFLFPTGCGTPNSLKWHSNDSSKAAKYYDSCNHKEYTWDPKRRSWSWILDSVAVSNTPIKIVTLGSLTGGGNVVAGGTLTLTGTSTGSILTVSGAENQINFTQSGGVAAGSMPTALIVSGSISTVTLIGTISTVAQPNITTVGTLTSLTVTGSLRGGTIYGNGSGIVNIPNASLSNSSITVIAGANMTGGGVVSLGGSITLSSTASGGGSPVTVTGTASQTVVTNTGGVYQVGLGSDVTISGSLTTGGTLNGILSTAAQPNVTSLGTLTNLVVSGNSSIGTLSVVGMSQLKGLTVTGDITASGTVTVANETVTGLINAAGITTTGAIQAKSFTGSGIFLQPGGIQVGADIRNTTWANLIYPFGMSVVPLSPTDPSYKQSVLINVGNSVPFYVSGIKRSISLDSAKIYIQQTASGTPYILQVAAPTLSNDVALTWPSVSGTLATTTSIGTQTDFTVTGTTTTKNLSVTGNAAVAGGLTVTGGIDAAAIVITGAAQANSITSTKSLTVGGVSTLNGSVAINSFGTYSSYLQSTRATSNSVTPGSANGSLVFGGGTSQTRIGTANDYNIDLDNSSSPIVGIHLLQNGNIFNAANTTLWNVTSDPRIKNNIHNVSSSLSRIMRLRPVNFGYIDKFVKYKNFTKTSQYKNQIGFIATDYQKIFPNYVTESDNEEMGIKALKSIDMSPVVPTLVGAMQEQQKQIQELQKQVTELKSIVQKLVKK